jgi:glycosyltransferase involved in cell wall biosynthesis
MLSIVIPTIRKVPEVDIVRSIQSAVNFSPKVVTEIVVVDNSQKPNPIALPLPTDNRIRIIQTTRSLNIAENWNFALGSAACGHAILLHDDDYLSKIDLSEREIDIIESFAIYPYDLTKGHFTERVSFGKHPHLPSSNSIFYRVPKFCSTIFNVSFWTKNIGWKMEDGHFLDYAAFLRANAIAPCSSGRQKMGTYCIHSTNLVMQDRNTKYGNQIPAILADLFAIYPDSASRAWILKNITDFCYGNESLQHRISKWTTKTFNRSLV